MQLKKAESLTNFNLVKWKQFFCYVKIWTGPGPSVRLIFCSRNGLTCWVAAGRGCRWQLDKTTLVREQGTSPAAPCYCHDSAGDSWPRRLNTRPAERKREFFCTKKQNSREMTGALLSTLRRHESNLHDNSERAVGPVNSSQPIRREVDDACGFQQYRYNNAIYFNNDF